MNLGALGGQLKKLGVTDDQVKKAEGLLGSNAALLGKAESALGGKKPAEETAAPAPGAGAVPPASPALETAPGPVDAPAAATATVAAAAVAGETKPAAGAAPVAPGVAADGPKTDAIHKVIKVPCCGFHSMHSLCSSSFSAVEVIAEGFSFWSLDYCPMRKLCMLTRPLRSNVDRSVGYLKVGGSFIHNRFSGALCIVFLQILICNQLR